jgi:hypothetical protein
MPKRYPPEFKRDVVVVARTSGLTQDQISSARLTSHEQHDPHNRRQTEIWGDPFS